jgi:hypothetical protein
MNVHRLLARPRGRLHVALPDHIGFMVTACVELSALLQECSVLLSENDQSLLGRQELS